MKLLREIFEDINSDLKIYSIHSDSRYVRPSSIFFCIEGLTVDGHQYIEDAIFQGAKVIVHSKYIEDRQPGIIYYYSDDVMGELTRVAALFYDHPSAKMQLIGVTGTNGKTIVAHSIKSIMDKYSGCGYIGTMATVFGNVAEHRRYTTPEPIYIESRLDQMVKSGIKVCTIEASSHGLALRRVEGLDFSICVLTNVFEEHLDFHGTMDHYVASKCKLFEVLKKTGVAVINRDDHYYDAFKNHTAGRIINYGIEHDSDVMAKNIKLEANCTRFDLILRGNTYKLVSPLIARFNVYNTLAIASVLLGLGFDNDMIIANLSSLPQIPGRMERVTNSYGINVIIDNCQYFSSYRNVFEFAKEIKKEGGRIIAIIGAPSKRNIRMRSQVGQLADQYCDHVILTEVDRRGEDPKHICEDIQNAMKDTSSVIITNRKIAIEQTIEMACHDDIILILGKGEEKFLTLDSGAVDYPGDKTVVLEALQSIYGYSEDEVNDLHNEDI